MEKIFVVKRLTRKLWATEAALDNAMGDAADLLADYLKAHQELKLPTPYCDSVQIKLVEAMKAMSEARTAMVAAHREMGITRERMGIRTKMGGFDTGPYHLLEDESEEVRLQNQA